MNFIDPADYDEQDIKTSFSMARDHGAQFIVVFIHWGPNWVWWPGVPLVQFGHFLIDAGADLILGHGTHNYQVVSSGESKPVMYSFITANKKLVRN